MKHTKKIILNYSGKNKTKHYKVAFPFKNLLGNVNKILFIPMVDFVHLVLSMKKCKSLFICQRLIKIRLFIDIV